MLPRLLTTIWQRKAVWKTHSQNKPSGTINPVYLPHKTPEQHKECVNQQNTVNHNSCPILFCCNFGGTSHEQQWPWSCSVLEDMHWKEMHQCLYFGLGVVCYWRASSWATSETTCYKISYSWTVACMLAGAVLSELAHPHWLWLSRHALQWVKARPPPQKKWKTTI